MIEPRHKRAKVDLVQINIAHGAAAPQFQPEREVVGQNRTKMRNSTLSHL